MIERPIFCRIGSKRHMSKNITSYFPSHLIYVEPFVGGGGIYWFKAPSPSEVINDLDKVLIDDYKMLKKAPLTGYEENLNTIPKLKKFHAKKHTSLQDKITNSIISRCNGFGGRYVTNNRIYRKSNPHSKTKNIEDYKNRIKNTIIVNESYEKVISDYDTVDTLFYLDPPYEDSKSVYKHHIIDYEKMVDILKKIKGKFILSINGSPYINKIFKDFKIIEIEKISNVSQNIGMRHRIELLIMNF